MQTLTLIRPDDWHLHLRDGTALATTVAHSAKQFARAIIMPNLKVPVTTTELALAYRDRILAAIPDGLAFSPLMTIYLADDTSIDEIKRAGNSKHIVALKLYPADATTNSSSGVTDIECTYSILEEMIKFDMPLLVHGEVTDPSIDIFDREKVFIERHLEPLTRRYPELKIVLEHITTREAVEFVTDSSEMVAATITAHHLLLNRNAMLVGGIHPHHYCLPVLKREQHRKALIKAATSGNPKFFLGSDSAPHDTASKESACGCAGIYTAHAAIELYTEIFDAADALDQLEGFSSLFGPDFYGIPRNRESVSLIKRAWTSPQKYNFGEEGELHPFRAGESLQWTLYANLHRTIQ